MRINAQTILSTPSSLLTPYLTQHVPRYHEWMQDPAIQAATASEPLTLEEEYAMQRSWRDDGDKLTFILYDPGCRGRIEEGMREGMGEGKGTEGVRGVETEGMERLGTETMKGLETEGMIGDVNMFLKIEDADAETGEEEQRANGRHVVTAELEIMIAETSARGKGWGRAALLMFLMYIVSNQEAIIEEFMRMEQRTYERLRRIEYFLVKIGEGNTRSLKLFESLGFERVGTGANYWGEVEMRLQGRDGVKGLLEEWHVDGYREQKFGE